MTVDADVIVIGAGPVGGLAARQLAKNGWSVLLIEEHNEVGVPVHCAGLIGIDGLHRNGVTPLPKVVIRRVHRSIFHAPTGAQLRVEKATPHAYVLHRDRLDQQIVQEAESKGATLQLKTRVIKCKREPSGMRVSVLENGSHRDLYARFVVNAEGLRAHLVHDQGLPRPKLQYMLPALQYEVTNVSIPTDTVHLFFDTRLANAFFSWIIPLTDHHARVGLATAHRQTRRALDKFLERCSLLSGAEIERRYGGVVYTGGPSSKTVAQRFVNVGDVAGQTKATTGGGVVTGGGCAILAAMSISRALEKRHYDHESLLRYERLWKHRWGRQLRLMSILRRFINTLKNHELDQLFIKLQNSKARQIIESRGDIDQQGRLIMTAVTSPVLLQSALHLLVRKARYLPKILWG